MEKKIEDGALDELINEQFIKEAQIMEKALFSDEDAEEYDPSEEEIRASYQELVARLKRDGIYREDKEENDIADKTDTNVSEMASMAEKVVPISGKRKKSYYKLAKIAGFVLVSGMCVFAASMTSEANREYFVKQIGVLRGEDTRVIVDNDDKNDHINTDEYAARDDIEKKLGIELPRFFYRPATFEYSDYEVNPYVGFARIEYTYKDTIIEFGIDKINESSKSNIDSIHGEELESVNIEREDIDAQISKIQDDLDTIPNYMAQWKKDGVLCYVVGKIELEELTKIISSICY